MLLRPFLSKLFFWSGAVSASASLWLPDPLASRLATLALGAAACSLLVWRGWKPASHALSAPPPAALDDGGLLDAMAQIERCCANAYDLIDALRGVGQVITYELGARNVLVALVEPGLFVPGQALLKPLLDPTAPHRQHAGQPLSVAADAALRERGIVSDADSGHALAVLDSGRPVALLEFEALELSVAPAALTCLLELIRSELNAVARRDRGDAGVFSPARLHTLRAQAGAPRLQVVMVQPLAREHPQADASRRQPPVGVEATSGGRAFPQAPESDADRRILPRQEFRLDEAPGAAVRTLPRPASASVRRVDLN